MSAMHMGTVSELLSRQQDNTAYGSLSEQCAGPFQHIPAECELMSASQMGTVSKIPGNTPDIPTTNPVADNSGGSATPEEAKPNA